MRFRVSLKCGSAKSTRKREARCSYRKRAHRDVLVSNPAGHVVSSYLQDIKYDASMGVEQREILQVHSSHPSQPADSSQTPGPANAAAARARRFKADAQPAFGQLPGSSARFAAASRRRRLPLMPAPIGDVCVAVQRQERTRAISAAQRCASL